jgi:RecA-family ATPase
MSEGVHYTTERYKRRAAKVDGAAKHEGPANGAAQPHRDERTPPPPDEEDDVDRELRDLRSRLIEAPALARRPEPRVRWLVEGVILDETVTLFSGNGSTGKSTIAMQLVADMQTNGDWLGIRVTQGPSIFLTSEDTIDDAHLMLRDILKAKDKSVAHCPGLRLISLADRDACLASASSKLAALEATPLWRAFEKLIEEIRPRLVVLDALADLFGGEENYRRHARSFMVLLKRLAIRVKLAVIIIAHPSISGMNTGSGLSGSTDWHNAARGRVYLEQPHEKDKTSDPAARTLTVKKVQRGEDGTVFRLRRHEGVFVYEGKDGGGAPYDKAAVSDTAERVFLALLQTYHEQGRSVSPNPSTSYAPAVFENDDDAEGVSKAALKRAMSQLLKANRVHVETIGPPSKQRKTLAPGPNPAKTTVLEREDA